MPAPRPAGLRQVQVAANPSRREVAQASAAAALEPEPKKPSIFEKLFGKPVSGGLQLAFAAPDGGVTSDGESLTLGRIPQYDQFTAVYDISARTVYLPNGTKLEAHSGLGKMIDDPRYADRKMRGVTPPHTYDLSLRERPFHGVEAIRLKPVGGEDKIMGAAGCSRIPICSGRTVTPTAACRSGTTTLSCAPTRAARSSGWLSSQNSEP